MLLGGTIIVVVMAPGFMADLMGALGRFIAYSHDLSIGSQGIGILLSATVKEIVVILFPPLGLLFVLAAMSSLVQNTPLFAAESLKPKFEKVSPAKGFKRLFSSRSMMEFIKGILKIVIVGAVAILVISPEFERLDRLPGMDTGAFLHVLWKMSSKMMIAVFAVVTVVAALDFMYQKMQHIKQLRMSRQEIKDEMKQSDGDPMVKARLRQIRMERARQRMMQAWRNAARHKQSKQGYSYGNRFSSGQRYGNGSWSHYNGHSNYGVGGTANGCIYTPNWSNC